MEMIKMTGITKKYPGVTALSKVDFSLKKGEIHSLLGENGAGKSTLMKVLYGLEQATEGSIFFNGKETHIKTTHDAIDLGIGMVHQHFMLAPVLTVMQNIVLGAEPKKGLFFDKKKATKEVSELIKRFNFKIDPNAKVSELSVGEQQRVEILKAMYRKAEVLILDEPTAVLTPQETEELFVILKQLKETGKSIILITHKLKETIAIADTISVLRKGNLIVGSQSLGDIDQDNLATQMVGRKVELGIRNPAQNIGESIIEVENINYKNKGHKVLENISFNISKGEILGVAGVEGNGQTELIEVLTGLLKPDSMNMSIDGQKLSGTAKDFLRAEIGHIPEDRHTRGAVISMPIYDNMILGYHNKEEFNNKGILRKLKIKNYAEDLVERFDIRTPSVNTHMSALSGGNQQKVVISRVFAQNPKAIIIAQPTRGVDVGAMEYIHKEMYSLRDEGKGILLISSDLDELCNLSDRLIVIYEGKIVAEGKTEDFTQTELGLLMNGGAKDE